MIAVTVTAVHTRMALEPHALATAARWFFGERGLCPCMHAVAATGDDDRTRHTATAANCVLLVLSLLWTMHWRLQEGPKPGCINNWCRFARAICVQDTVDADSAVDQLQAAGISTSVTGIASTRLDFEARRLPDSMIRASVHYYNNEQVHPAPKRVPSAHGGAPGLACRSMTASIHDAWQAGKAGAPLNLHMQGREQHGIL